MKRIYFINGEECNYHVSKILELDIEAFFKLCSKPVRLGREFYRGDYKYKKVADLVQDRDGRISGCISVTKRTRDLIEEGLKRFGLELGMDVTYKDLDNDYGKLAEIVEQSYKSLETIIGRKVNSLISAHSIKVGDINAESFFKDLHDFLSDEEIKISIHFAVEEAWRELEEREYLY